MPKKNTRGGNRKPSRNKKNNGNYSRPNSPQKDITAITYSEGITVGQLAQKCGRSASDIIKVLFMEGKMVTINSVMDDDMVETVCIMYTLNRQK